MNGDFFVDDDGIYKRLPVSSNSTICATEIVMTKEVFLEALRKWRPSAQDIVDDVMNMSGDNLEK